MNSRKFLFIVSTFLIVCLFIGGSALLVLAKANIPIGFLSSVTTPLKSENGTFNVLVLGGDYVGANTDTILVANINTATGKINIMSVPRDTKVNIKGSSVPKINSAYSAGGPDLAVNTVSNLLNINIKYYAFINTEGFREIIDLLDGIDLEILANMDYDDPTQDLHIHLKKGMQHLDGNKAEQYIRFRHPNTYNNEILQYYDGSDLKRIEAQQRFIKELIRQKATLRYVSRADELVKASLKYIKTNITTDEAVKILGNAGNIKANEVTFFRMPGTASEEGLSYYIIDKQQTQDIIKNNFQTK